MDMLLLLGFLCLENLAHGHLFPGSPHDVNEAHIAAFMALSLCAGVLAIIAISILLAYFCARSGLYRCCMCKSTKKAKQSVEVNETTTESVFSLNFVRNFMFSSEECHPPDLAVSPTEGSEVGPAAEECLVENPKTDTEGSPKVEEPHVEEIAEVHVTDTTEKQILI